MELSWAGWRSPGPEVSSPENKSFRYLSTQEQRVASKLVGALKQCSDLERGKELHSFAVTAGCHTDKYVATALINMYSRCGRMQDARAVFERMPDRDVVTWSSLILGYAENGESSVAMQLFKSMDCEPSSATYVAALKACGGLGSETETEKEVWLQTGMAMHEEIRDQGRDSHVVVATTLVDMYARCGSMKRARDVFDKTPARNVVSWNCLILGYVDNGESSVAMELFEKMDCQPSPVTFVAALKACIGLVGEKGTEKAQWLAKGMAIHNRVRECGYESNIVVATTLLDMYSKCGSMSRARDVFDKIPRPNVVSWNCLLLGYVENGECSVAMEMFERMDCEPDAVTFIGALKACAGLAADRAPEKRLWLLKGIAIHRRIRKLGIDCDVTLTSSLLDMYTKCGSMSRARKLFDSMPHHQSVVSWTSLILGYTENGQSSLALDLFARMSCEPNYVTYVAVLKACGNLAAVPVGRLVHAEILKRGLEQYQMVANSLLDFYGNSGAMDTAEQVFNGIHSPDVVSWTALISGYSSFGEPEQVFSLVRRMQEAGVQPNAVTFTSILTACSHAGKVDEAEYYFRLMAGYGVCPSVEHYNCIVDMLGRGKRVQEAVDMVRRISSEANDVTWMTLLGSRKERKSLERVSPGKTARLLKTITECNSKVTEQPKPGQTWWCDSSGRILHFPE